MNRFYGFFQGGVVAFISVNMLRMIIITKTLKNRLISPILGAVICLCFHPLSVIIKKGKAYFPKLEEFSKI